MLALRARTGGCYNALYIIVVWLIVWVHSQGRRATAGSEIIEWG